MWASEPGEWSIVLANGWVLGVVAHGYGAADDHHSFVLLLDDDPAVELVVARIPSAAIQSVEGG